MRRIPERRGARDAAEEGVRHPLLQRGALSELLDGQLIQIRVRQADPGDLRPGVGDFHRDVRRELALDRRVPLLHVAGAQVAVHGKDALAQARVWRQRNRLDAGTRGERECRDDVVQRALRDGLQERKHRRRERRRDARHLDPHQPVADSRHGPLGQAADDAEAGSEIELVKLARGTRLTVPAQKLELLRLQVEDRGLVVLFGGRKVQRVSHAGVDGHAVGHAPVVLDEVLLEMGPVANLLLLQVDRELLNLAQEKARERRAGIGGAGKVGEQVAERERARRRWRLDHVEALPAQVRSHLQRMSSLQPRQ